MILTGKTHRDRDRHRDSDGPPAGRRRPGQPLRLRLTASVRLSQGLRAASLSRAGSLRLRLRLSASFLTGSPGLSLRLAGSPAPPGPVAAARGGRAWRNVKFDFEEHFINTSMSIVGARQL
eukprot:3266019-Rhodomonas_salina.2